MPEELTQDPDELEEEPEADAEGDGEAEEADPLLRAERERDEYLVNWQRALADYQNLRRRTLEDIEQAVYRERSGLLEEALTVLDYLDMALDHPCESEEARNLQVGVRMTRDQLWALLERSQVSLIEAQGAFDPDRHQAIATVETAQVPPGEIVEVVRRGFTIGDRVLRYAHVKVAAAEGASQVREGEPESPAGDRADGGENQPEETP